MFSNLWTVVVVASLAETVFGDDIFTNRFADIRFTPTFIDKTLLLHRVFEHKYLSIYAPEGFGKSANIGMFNLFLSNLRTKETIEEYFSGTEIWKDKSFVEEHYGEYPVILFNTTVCGVVYDEDHMVATFQWVLHTTFKDHKYLLRNGNITGEKMELLKRHLNLKSSQCMTKEEVTKGVALLAELLHQHHERPVIVLVDGFGKGVVERLFEDNTDLRYLNGEVIKWYSAIYNNIFDSPYIERVIVSGEIHPYGLHLPQFHSVSFMEDPKYSHFYGFTYDELEYLLCKFSVALDHRPQVLRWFCGYSSIDGEVKVCHSQSVLHVLSSPYHITKMYSFSSAIGRDLIQRMVDAEKYISVIGSLVRNTSVDLSLSLDLTREIGYYRLLLEGLGADSEEFVGQLLLQTGLLTYAGPGSEGKVSLRMPNEEIRSTVDKFVSLLSFI